MPFHHQKNAPQGLMDFEIQQLFSAQFLQIKERAKNNL